MGKKKKAERRNPLRRRSPEENLKRAKLQSEAAKLTASGIRTGVDYEKMETFTVGESEEIPEAP